MAQLKEHYEEQAKTVLGKMEKRRSMLGEEEIG
jgi:hypothetical protein